MKQEIGLIGMGVMGTSLSRNLARNGFAVSLYNRHVEGSEEAVAQKAQKQYEELASALAFDTLSPFVASLSHPRKIILMVNAGAAVDAVLNELLPQLDAGDVIVDGGNSHYSDTQKRMASCAESGIHFLGVGISGGEKGALHGPAIMPSGSIAGYALMQPYLEKIAAKNRDGHPCCSYVGPQGSGHFVKMVHNGVEYVEMQLIAECYALLKQQGCTNDAIADYFTQWLPECQSYLLSISIKILQKKEGDHYLLDRILDQAANKGTGRWSAQAIADFGEAATLIPAALWARYLSYFKKYREQAAAFFQTNPLQSALAIDQLKAAYQWARVVNHHQGFSLIQHVSNTHEWNVHLPNIARLWTAGCIIQSDLMYTLSSDLATHQHLLLHPRWKDFFECHHTAAKAVAKAAIDAEVHLPCLLEAVNFFHGYKTLYSSANLIQAQRDFFGAHTYQRTDDSSGKSHHTLWE